MNRRDFLKNTGILLTFPSLLSQSLKAEVLSEKAIILGFDGMDPGIIMSMVKKGELPNIRKFFLSGSISKMISTAPPESPCAWASFSTGLDPGGHGIFGFIHKRPGTYFPDFNMTSIIPPENPRLLGIKLPKETPEMFGYKFPLAGGDIQLNRKGKPFWDYLQDREVESIVMKMPSNYPPSEMKHGRSLSGLGTPDVKGGNGSFLLYTTDEEESMQENARGTYYYAYFDENNMLEGQIEGPENVYKENKEAITIPFKVYFDSKHKTSRIDVQGKELLLKEGELSDWVELKFDLIPNVESMSAIVRFYLLDAQEDKFRLYISAPYINPADPAQPISSPESYSKELADKLGPFHTLGLPSDFNAIRAEVFNMENYIVQSETIFKESNALFNYEFERFLKLKRGMLFFYFSTIDQGSHIYWGLRDPKHPYYKPDEAKRYGDQIEEMYRKFDKIVGDVAKKLPPKVPLIILSDHGFGPLRRLVNVNTLLHQNGFLKFNSEPDYSDSAAVISDGNWDESKAFAMGLNGLYLNMMGREPNGIVRPDDKKKVMQDIKNMLLSLKDPQTGENPVGKVFITEENYSSQYLEMGPDMIVGYNRGYGLDSSSALGGIGRTPFKDNLNRWTGDHIIDPHQVPAVLMTNFKISDKRVPRIWDLAPTILKIFGIPTPSDMRGKSLI